MATIVEQQPAAGSEESAARQFWREKMEKHPNLAGGLAIASEVAGFFLNGQVLIRFGQWMVRVTGSIAETALLFAVLWISATSVAPHLVELIMNEQTMQYLVWLALIVLALVPEVILANALVNALGHWHSVTLNRRNLLSWAWALLFTVPTALFLGLTAYTLNTLVANGGNFVQASTGLVGLRCFAGWTYGLLEMVYAGVGRTMINQVQPPITPAQPAPARPLDSEEIARQLLPLVVQEVKTLLPAHAPAFDYQQIAAQVSTHVAAVYAPHLQQLRVNVEEMATRMARQPATVDETEDETTITSCEDRSVHLKQKIDEPDEEPNVEPRPRITVKLQQERSDAKRSTRRETKSETPPTRGTAQEKALRIIQRNPDIDAATLAKRAHITPQYASRILKKQSASG
jgi:hypothetical protein